MCFSDRARCRLLLLMHYITAAGATLQYLCFSNWANCWLLLLMYPHISFQLARMQHCLRTSAGLHVTVACNIQGRGVCILATSVTVSGAISIEVMLQSQTMIRRDTFSATTSTEQMAKFTTMYENVQNSFEKS